ncbi:cytochrome P450 [Streptomyces eurythermus]|uniref:cytochrome P450 n=1 Tax=Streptomyces eurythermus TaxID=42237 RepID=UPI0033CE4857
MEIFEPLTPRMLQDPYPVYAQLRETDPAHWHEGLHAWIISRYDDCLRILRDVETFRSDFRITGEETPVQQLTLQTLDPPEHTNLRKVIASALKQTGFEGVLRHLETAVEKRLSHINLDSFDFIGDFAEPVAIASMCAYFGVPDIEDPAMFQKAQRILLLSMDSGLAPEAFQPGIEARIVLDQLLESWLADLPGEGLLSHVDLSGKVAPRRYTRNALRGVFGAGYGSSSHMWGNALNTLLSAGLLDREIPLDITRETFNELIRFDGAVQAESRAVAHDTVVAGQEIKQGDVVVTLLGAANRDPRQFTDPDELHLERTPNPHLGFGRGIHACLGGHLAVQTGVQLFQFLTRRFTFILLEEPVRRPTATQRGFDQITVRATPR